MKILIISDLHLCDIRNSPAFEMRRLERLAELIRKSGAAMILNLGDTVSSQEFLRPDTENEENGFRYYREWRDRISVPFAECAVKREFPFFADILGQQPDSICDLFPDIRIITMAPQEAFDHRFSKSQLQYIEQAIRSCPAPRILIGTHVPYPNSCSRPAKPGIFLEIPEQLCRLVENSGKAVYWCGGHFHWDPEEPCRFGSLTAFHGGRFSFENHPGKNGWLRSIDTATGQIKFELASFDW